MTFELEKIVKQSEDGKRYTNFYIRSVENNGVVIPIRINLFYSKETNRCLNATDFVLADKLAILRNK